MTGTSDPDRLNAEGLARLAARDLAGAAARFRRALALAPAFVAAAGNLGNLEAETGALEAACRQYQRGLASAPGMAALHLMLGTARLRQRRDEQGRSSLARAIKLNPGYPKAHLNLGLHDLELGRSKEAEFNFRRALDGDPTLAPALAGRARALSALARSRDAWTMCRRAMALAPSSPESLAALGQTAFDVGDHAFARRGFSRGIAVDPGASALKALMFYLHYDPTATSERIFRLHRQWAAASQKLVAPAPPVMPRARPRLRVGYVSGDLYDHPVGRTIVGLIENHDPSEFETYLYSEWTEQDLINARLRRAAAAWRDTQTLDDPALAALIRRDEIDILVIVAGHTARNRVTIAAHRPAPVLVSMYDFTTSGFDGVDWLLGDETLTPADGTEGFTEHVFRLPGLYVQTAIEEPPVDRAGTGFVFGSCANPVKLNESVISTWSAILDGCPTARLVLKYRDAFSDPDLVRHFHRRFAAHGVAASRVVFDGRRTARKAHLAFVGQFDVALDTFPFNGCTTTFEALWMGVPVVTLLGARLVGRMSAAMLRRIGLGDLVAVDEAAYVATAVGLAKDAERRRGFRTGLRARLLGSPLLDGPAYARTVEAAYRAMWEDARSRASTDVQNSPSAIS